MSDKSDCDFLYEDTDIEKCGWIAVGINSRQKDTNDSEEKRQYVNEMEEFELEHKKETKNKRKFTHPLKNIYLSKI